MFYYLKGSLAVKQEDMAVIESGGVGYCVAINARTYEALPGLSQEVKLFTHLYLREEIADLYGFLSEGEVRMFKLLLSVSGVGPKAANAILSVLPPSNLAMCVMTNDTKAFTIAPGIGVKTAQRLILELKDKVKKEQKDKKFADLIRDAGPVAQMTKYEEASDALSMLGYSALEIGHALKGRDFENTSLEEIIKEALKALVK